MARTLGWILVATLIGSLGCNRAHKQAPRVAVADAPDPPVAKKPSKKDVFRQLHGSGFNVYVNFDARRDGVKIPNDLRDQPRVVFVYGQNLPVPIPDLRVTESGIRGTLSFDQKPVMTFVPWSAVFAIIGEDKRGMLWEEDVPAEVREEEKNEDKHI